MLTDTHSDDVRIFYDFDSTAPGRLKEETNSNWQAQGKIGTTYAYDSGQVASICTAQGQEYFVGLTRTGSGLDAKLTTVEVKTDANGTVLADTAYTYFDANVHSADVGSDGDLVQVRTRQLKTGSTSEWIVRYVQYRYYHTGDSDGKPHQVKAVFQSDAVQRIIDDRGDISAAADILAKGDNDGSTGHKIKDFASRRFTYYTSNLDTSQAITTVFGSEHLQSTYGGIDVDETANGVYMVKSEMIGGCAGCGTVGGMTYNYYYMNISHANPGPNDVIRLVVEDTVDANGAGVSRTVSGVSDGGQQLRQALILDPVGTPKFWCTSSKLSNSTTTELNRLYEYRSPAAHNVTVSTIANFLDPSTGSNDANTLNQNDGMIQVYEYDGDGMLTATKVKQGSSGTAYYVWSQAFYGGSNVNRKYLVTHDYQYPQQTTSINDASRIDTQHSYTFWSGTDTIQTITTTLPSVSTSENGSGTATVETQYFDNVGRLRWTKDGEGYVTYYSYHPKFGGAVYTIADADPNSLPASADGNSTKWVTSSDGSAGSNKPTRGTGLPTARQQVNKSELDAQGRTVFSATEDGQTGTDLMKHYAVFETNRTLEFRYWQSGSNKPLLPINVTVTDDGGKSTESYTVDPNCVTVSGGVPTDISATQSDYLSWTRNTYNSVTGELISTDRYHDIPSSGTGTLSTNFYRTAYLYDPMGRQGATIQVVSGTDPNSSTVDQVSVSIFDAVGRVVKTKQGVSGSNDGIPTSYATLASETSPPSWLATVSQTEYDGNSAGGNNLVTRSISYYGTGSTDNTGKQFYYTYRGHQRRPVVQGL